MTAQIFCGPGEYVYPMYLDPRGSGTLVAQPGETYDFGNEDPPEPAAWWIPVAPPPPAAKAAATPATPAAPAAPAPADTATGQEG